MASTELALERVRRSYSKTLKAQVVAECKQAGNSVAGVALKHGINANIVHKWLRLSEAEDTAVSTVPAFVPVTLKSEPARRGSDIHVEIRRGDTTVILNWPQSDSTGCAAWLSEWLR